MGYLFFILLIIESLFLNSYADELDSITNGNLKSCISDYRDGYYSRAIECINQSIPGLTTLKDSVQSYKMLGLSYGMVNQIEKAKMYFGLALEKDSTVEIDTLAFPPNITLIYNQVKLEKKMSRIETAPSSASTSAPATPQATGVYKKKRSAAAPILLSTVILSTAGAVYLYYNGYIARKDYSNLGNDQSKLNKKWDEFTYSIAGGVSCTVISGVATWLFFRVINKNAAISISGWNNGILLGYDF